MEKMNDLRDLLRHEIQDLYSAEEQIIAALPLMVQKADNKNLKAALQEHLRITKEQKKRLDKVQKLMQSKPEENKKGFLSGLFGGGKHVCKGMQGIIEEGNKIMAENMEPRVRDAAIIAAAQKVEHYEICGYGTARTYAKELGLTEVHNILEETLNEEYEADGILTNLATEKVNPEAEMPSGSGDTTGSGSAKGRSGRESSQRIRREEPEMEAVSNSRSSSGRSGSENPRTKSATGGRNAESGRESASSKRSSGNARASKSGSRSSGSGNGRSSGGRSSSR